MRPVVTAEEMRRADAAAIAAGTPAETLMERAGRAVARAVVDMTGRRYGARVVVVCGPGNNGGDGYVAARVLQAQGASVCCLAVAAPSGPPGPATASHDRFVRAGGVVRPFERRWLHRADVIVDAIFGTGFHGRPEGPARDAIEAIREARNGRGDAPENEGGSAVLSVDVPSGCGGERVAVISDVTVAVAAEKLETAVAGEEAAGEVFIADIGIDVVSSDAWMPGPEDLAAIARRDPGVHKWSRSVAILAGADAMTGAPVLAARAAFRAGAGYVTLGTTPGADRVARGLVPEAVVRVVTEGSVLTAAAVDAFRATLEKAGAVAVGPGIGTGPDQREMVARVLRELDQPVVLDADGLNVLQGDTEVLTARTGPLAITPHAGELGRLLGYSAEDVTRDRVAAVREASRRFGCTVLLKGPRTLTCHHEEALIINPTGGSELATAGTGDVLTGVTVALAAGGDGAFTAAWQAAYLHGSAGGIAANRKGHVGIVAWDVAEALPEAIAALAHA
ncbi:MAG: ADP-dependent NAD(P)H-hydrate dehydratase / NAD(P)H-hydrate epimerase [Actinomycetota bacterium]|jgi:NAD(P)H-hydrate epimerase|nr:ADP-dependent NAD(P)H-hydrate dehydratase / NAD(P)H-hydrate epimerase [Actinomycetota bacterium]